MKLSNYIPSAWVDVLICWLFGLLGVHKFREKKIGMGVVYLCTCGLFFFGWIYDLAKYLTIAICQTLHAQKKSNLSTPDSQTDDPPNFQALAKKIALAALGFALAFGVLITSCSSNDDSTTDPTVPTTIETVDTTTDPTEHITESSTEAITDPSTEAITQPTVESDSTTTTEPATTPSTTPTTEPTPPVTTEPVIESTTPPTTEPPHTHSFSAATCTTPATCSCGAIEGEANGHNWKDATCSDPKMCTACGITSGLTAGHSFSNGKCTTCGKEDPDYNHETMVWIPTNGGTKYHSRAGCSNMEDPVQVTQSEAESRGFTPCKKCH